jgi:replicative DNA helicase
MNNISLLEDEPINVQQIPIKFGNLKQTVAVLEVFNEVMQKRRSGIKTHVDTGIARLDEAMPSLLEAGDFIILAARPSMGKSALGYQILTNVARSGKSTFFFSIEMSNVQIVERHIAASIGLSVQKLRNPESLTDDEELGLAAALKDFSSLPMFIDEKPKTINEITAETKVNSAKLASAGMPPLGLILVDYLTIVQPSERAGTNELEIKEICRKLKSLAKELQVPVIALAQLNRKLEERPNKRPLMSDIRESGQIEQEADSIIFLYRDDIYNKDTPEKGVAEIIAGKRRMFELATAKLRFDGERMQFCELDLVPVSKTRGRNGAI